jgi:outer membrane protein, multidrug efflux system
VTWALAILLAASRPAPPPAPAPPAPDDARGWTLEAFTAAAQRADPRALAAAAELSRLRAAESGSRAAGGPTLAWALRADGPVPELKNDPDHLDAVQAGSRLRNGVFGSAGVHGHVGATLDWPVFTFGRASARGAAAAHESAAGEGSAQAARARASRDAAEIFWSWQVARRTLAALEDLDRQLAGARERMDELAGRGSPRVSRRDVAEIDVVRADLGVRRADAAAARDLAMEAGRLAVGAPADAPFAFAAAALDPPPIELQPAPHYADAAAQRADVAAAREEVRAREALADARRKELYPELAVVGFADLNWTGSATPQTNPFAYDPWNRLWGGVGLELRGTLDLGRTRAAAVEAEAAVEKARAQADVAARTARLEALRAHAALRSALDRAARLRDEEAAARRWLSQAELSFDAGGTDAQSVLVAALAAARAGAERLAAVRDAHLALADLALASGEDARRP